ncbi:MAG: hypothetical protein ABI683_03365 [Ginsengibacter sp.]
MIKNFFEIAYRNILGNKGFSCINISGLAIGMASAALFCTHSFGIGYRRNYHGKFAGNKSGYCKPFEKV